jgi:hypothetical protein
MNVEKADRSIPEAIRLAPSVTTASGLPVSGSTANTSTKWNANFRRFEVMRGPLKTKLPSRLPTGESVFTSVVARCSNPAPLAVLKRALNSRSHGGGQ